MDKVFSWILVRLVDCNSILYVSWAKIIKTDWNSIKINDFERNSISKMSRTKHTNLNVPSIQFVHHLLTSNRRHQVTKVHFVNIAKVGESEIGNVLK